MIIDFIKKKKEKTVLKIYETFFRELLMARGEYCAKTNELMAKHAYKQNVQNEKDLDFLYNKIWDEKRI